MSYLRSLRAEIIAEYRNDQKVADDDKLLIARIWERHGWNNLDRLYNNLSKMPSAESIRRTRQKLVADGVIKSSKEAVEKRYKAFKEYRKELDYGRY